MVLPEVWLLSLMERAGLVAERAATFATSPANAAQGFPPFVADVAALAYAKSDLPSMARTSSVMLLPCAAISTGSRPWLRHNAQLRLGGSIIMRADLTWLLATKRQQNIFCRQSLRRRRRVKRPLKTNAGYGQPIPSASMTTRPNIPIGSPHGDWPTPA